MVKLNKKNKQCRDEFKTPTQRVGKKKLDAKNSTRSDVRTRAIIVPKQSIMMNKLDPSAPTMKGHDLRTLLQHTKHHNTSFRKNAIQSVLDLCNQNVEYLQFWVGSVAQETIDLAVDEEPQVRSRHKKLIELLCDKLPTEKLRPFSQFFNNMVISSLTHLQKDIREHGVSLSQLSIFQECPRVIPLLLNYLSANPNASQTVTTSLQPLLDNLANSLFQNNNNDNLVDEAAASVALFPPLVSAISGSAPPPCWPPAPSASLVDLNQRIASMATGIKALLVCWMQSSPETSNKSSNATAALTSNASTREWQQARITNALLSLMHVCAHDEYMRLQTAKFAPSSLIASKTMGSWEAELDLTLHLTDLENQLLHKVLLQRSSGMIPPDRDPTACEVHDLLLATMAAPFCAMTRRRIERLAPPSADVSEKIAGRLRHPYSRLTRLPTILNHAALVARCVASRVTNASYSQNNIEIDPVIPLNVGAPASASFRLAACIELLIELLSEVQSLMELFEELITEENGKCKFEEIIPLKKARECLDTLIGTNDILWEIISGFTHYNSGVDIHEESNVNISRKLIWTLPLLVVRFGLPINKVADMVCPPKVKKAFNRLIQAHPDFALSSESKFAIKDRETCDKYIHVLAQSFSQLPAAPSVCMIQLLSQIMRKAAKLSPSTPMPLPIGLLNFFVPLQSDKVEVRDEEIEEVAGDENLDDECEPLLFSAPEEVRLNAIKCLRNAVNTCTCIVALPGSPLFRWCQDLCGTVMPFLAGDELVSLIDTTLDLVSTLNSSTRCQRDLNWSHAASLLLEVLATAPPYSEESDTDLDDFVHDQFSVINAFVMQIALRMGSVNWTSRIRIVQSVLIPMCLRTPETGLPQLKAPTFRAGLLAICAWVSISLPQPSCSTDSAHVANGSSLYRIGNATETILSVLRDDSLFTKEVRLVANVRDEEDVANQEWKALVRNLLGHSVSTFDVSNVPLSILAMLVVLRIAASESTLQYSQNITAQKLVLADIRMQLISLATSLTQQECLIALRLLLLDGAAVKKEMKLTSKEMAESVNSILAASELNAKAACFSFLQKIQTGINREMDAIVAKIRLVLQGSLLAS